MKLKKMARQNPESVFHQSAFSTTQPLWNSAESEKVPFLNAFGFFFPPPGHFFLWECVEVFLRSWVNDQSFYGGKGAIVVCCQTSWFCTQQLPHHLSLCILIISREHHSVASILLPAFSSLPRSLWHPRLFFHCFSFMCGPLLTGGHWSFMQSHCSVISSSKHLHLSSHRCVLLFLPHLCVKSCYCSLLQPHAPSPTDLAEPSPARWHWQIKNTSENLSDLVFYMFLSLSVFIFWVPICHTEKPAWPWFYCTSLLKTSPNLCSASSDARQEAAEEAR